MSKDGADSFKHVYHNGPMSIEQVREALGFTLDYRPMRGGKPLDGLEYDSAIHNRIKSWFVGIDLTEAEQFTSTINCATNHEREQSDDEERAPRLFC